MLKGYIIMCLMILMFGACLGKDKVYDPIKYGAKADGTTLCTEAIQKAIDECASAGGGTVRLSGGRFLSGTIFMKSGVTLEIDRGSTLLGSPDLDDYPVTVQAFRSYTDRYTDRSLIYGEALEDIAIIGKGTIDGQGGLFNGIYKKRPFVIRFISCKNILVKDVMLRNSAMWMQHYLACDNVTIRGIKAYNHCNRNNDMLDIDGCHNVLITGVVGDSDDDGITLKSTSARACENVTITDCTVSSHCNAIKLGTESNGGFKNVNISDCVIKPSADSEPIYGRRNGLAGIALEIVDGGTMDGVNVSNVRIEKTTAPIFVRLGDRARPFRKDMPRPGVGVLRNVNISDVVATGAGPTGCAIAGIAGHYVENLILKNLKFSFAGGGKIEDTTRNFGEQADRYPESTMFARRLPAFGLFCWHVRGLKLDGVELRTVKPDERPAIALEDVIDIVIDGKLMDKAKDFPEGVLLLQEGSIQ